MIVTLYEVEITAKRAVRGAGFDWGTADEAAWATRWLAERGLAGPEALAGLLEDPNAGRNGPLVAGPALTDRTGEIAPGWSESFPAMRQPTLFLPFVAASAGISGQTLSMEWDEVRIVTDGAGLSLIGDPSTDAPADISVAVAAATCETVSLATSARVSRDAWAALQALGHKTFAPATEESRMRGAGESA